MSTAGRSYVRCGKLSSAFSTSDKELYALIACLCVLFEDLRMELARQIAEEIHGVDECSKAGRKFYFLRRSIATLHEFAIAIERLDQYPSFQPIKAVFHALSKKHWNRAVKYFRKHKSYIARLRNNVGGHFGPEAAKSAISHLLPDVVGTIEVTFTNGGGGAKLLFAHEIAATGALYHVPGADTAAKSRRLIRQAVVGYRKAIWAVDCIGVEHLWDRFGR
jgi:hypothetical protein